jgi:hypothetical protein
MNAHYCEYHKKKVKNVPPAIADITFLKCSSIFMLYNGASRYTRKFGALH